MNRIEKENPDWKQQDKVNSRFTKRLDETGLPEKAMTFRFRIGDMLAVIALVALFVGFFAPELRSWDRNALVVFVATGIITAVSLVSFTPGLDRPTQAPQAVPPGLEIRAVDYAAVFVAFLSGLGILIAIGFAIRWMVDPIRKELRAAVFAQWILGSQVPRIPQKFLYSRMSGRFQWCSGFGARRKGRRWDAKSSTTDAMLAKRTRTRGPSDLAKRNRQAQPPGHAKLREQTRDSAARPRELRQTTQAWGSNCANEPKLPAVRA